MNLESTPTLYEKYGAAIDELVSLFYQKVLADKDLESFFQNVNMDQQKRHMAAFITYALGGPNNYNGRNMQAAHRGQKIQEYHFNAVAGHLSDAMTQLGVDEKDKIAILGTIQGLKDAIVNA